MSLVQSRLVAVAVAGALAVVAPMAILRGGQAHVVVPPAPVQTRLMVKESGGLAYAMTAPPFTPGRAPAPAPGLPGDASQAGQAAPAAPPPVPKLVGLVTGGRGPGVALVRSSSGETVMLSSGDKVDGWRLLNVGRQQALFELNGTRQVATLDFSNKEGSGQVPAQGAPPAPPEVPPQPPFAAPASGSASAAATPFASDRKQP